jgi:hypothetical protein
MTYLNVAQLRDRGWNDRLIKSMLGEPDDTFLPRISKPGWPQRLYLTSRVVAAETNDPDFRRAIEHKQHLVAISLGRHAK